MDETETLQQLANGKNVLYFEASAKTGEGVREAFQAALKEFLRVRQAAFWYGGVYKAWKSSNVHKLYHSSFKNYYMIEPEASNLYHGQTFISIFIQTFEKLSLLRIVSS